MNFLLPIGITFLLVIALILVLSALDVSLTSEIGKVTVSVSGLLSLGLQYTLLYQVNRATAMYNFGISQKLEEYKSILQKGVEAEKTYLNEGLEEHKSILNSYLENHKLGTNKQLEDHKLGLQNNLESYKNSLNKDVKIYEKRLNILTETYSGVIDIHEKLRIIINNAGISDYEELDKYKKEFLLELTKKDIEFRKNSLFFTDNLYISLVELLGICIDASSKIKSSLDVKRGVMSQDSWDESVKKARELSQKNIFNAIYEIKNSIEDILSITIVDVFAKNNTNSILQNKANLNTK